MSAEVEDDYDTRIPLPAGYEWGVNALVFSSSQFDTWDICKRKWFFRFWRKLPTPPNVALTFGTTLHKVCERWLNADDQGRDPATGKAVEFYPEGWDAKITPHEAALIKKLVAESIEKGILVRLPGREIEKDFLHFMVQAEQFSIFVRGSIDYLVAPDLIEDHKTAKSRQYIKSPAKLATANQPLIYGRFLLLRLLDEGKPFPERIQVTHNYFVKGDGNKHKPGVKKVIAKLPDQEPGVTPAQIEARWEQLTATALQMAQITKITNWHDTPDPPDFAKACNAYGGCPYRSICAGRETPEHYTKRLEMSQQASQEKVMTTNTILAKNLAAAKAGGNVPSAGAPAVNGSVPAKGPAAAPKPAAAAPKPAAAPKAATPAKKKDDRKFFVLDPATGAPMDGERSFDEVYAMIGETSQDLQLNPSGTPDWKAASDLGGFEVVLAMIAQGGKADATPTTTPAAPAAPETKPQRTAPWANEKCTACSKNAVRGFNSKGGVCKTCEAHYGKTVATVYKIEVGANGEISWTEIASADSAAIETAAGEIAGEPSNEPASEPSGEASGESTAGTSGETLGDPIAGALATARRGRGRPAKGFTLLVNIACSKGFPASVQLDDFLVHYGRELAKASATPDNGVESYYDLDAFARRDKLSRVAEKIAKELGTAYVFVNGQDPDTRALVAALRPYAGAVFEATK